VEVETGKWKSWWKIQHLLANRRGSQMVLDFLSSTNVGRVVLPLEETDAESEASER
jgi:hypothetical protein